jgi:hypothetical protein
MYRDWELIDVLATQIAAAGAGSEAVTSAIDAARAHITRGDNEATVEFLDSRLRPLLAGDLLEILDDLADAVRNDLT